MWTNVSSFKNTDKIENKKHKLGNPSSQALYSNTVYLKQVTKVTENLFIIMVIK